MWVFNFVIMRWRVRGYSCRAVLCFFRLGIRYIIVSYFEKLFKLLILWKGWSIFSWYRENKYLSVEIIMVLFFRVGYYFRGYLFNE